MSKLIAAMNMTLDGYCDHRDGAVSAELHDYYTEQIKNAGVLLYGRITYQLMEDAWPEMLKNPTGVKSLDDFAKAIDGVPKIVFSNTLTHLNWHSSTLATRSLQHEVTALKQEMEKDIMVGSPSLIAQLTQLGLVDEYRICIHPIIAGNGPVLFKDITQKVKLKVTQTQTLALGVIALRYERVTE